jgi:hypothetical protein
MRRIFRATTESVFGTFDSSPAGQDYIPMDTPNSFKPMTTRPVWTIRDGSGPNIPYLRGSEILQVQGKLTTRLYWETVQYWATWMTRINSAQTSPWATNQKHYDYASKTLDFGYTYDDETMKRMRYLGCKPGANVTFTASNAPENPFLTLDMDIFGQKPVPNVYTTDATPTATDFPEPTGSQLPTNPIVFQECQFTYANTINDLFDRFTVTIASMVRPYFDNGRIANRIHCRGRTVTLSCHPLLQVVTDPRLKYEAQQAIGNCKLVFSDGGTHTLTFDFRSNSYLDSINEDMVLDEDAYTDFTATALLDTGPGDDFSISFL